MMKRCAFLTLADPTGYVIDDDLAVPALAAHGWSVDSVPWTADVDWSGYDVVVIRSTWDYQHDAQRFVSVLADISAVTRLENPLPIVQWNYRKTYLRDLEARGVSIVPTTWRDALDPRDFTSWFEELRADELVIKPQIGANAGDTLRVRRDDVAAQAEAIRTFAARPHMVQPFLPTVTDEGEYSLIMFDGELSHAILKTPKPGDFRVQEEHGGIIQSVDAPPSLIRQAHEAMRSIEPAPLYARADFVRLHGDIFGMMELELIEPSLYFRKDAASMERFAAALDRRLQSAEAA